MPSAQERESALFALALEKPLSERSAFLQAVCGEKEVLRQRLEALLAAHDQPDNLVPTQAEAARPTIKLDLGDAPDEAVGQTLGRYKLLERVGEGGCGVVYVAEQTEPMRRRVALKVIRLGMDTKQVVARFEAERQALAMMDHPNIAKVLDAGTAETGRPYFVMELVRGIRITDFCDQERVATQERLELFIKVCQAIQHAHQKGIIHRDIKPSNILVTLHDGAPVPKVIDFGIAKATEGRLTAATVYTQLHQFIGTPAYMSPEQAEMSGMDIDTRSDIYSLGVLLYELLTGKTPFDAQELMSQGLDAMRKTIREKEPVRPSTKVATLNREELTTAVHRRASDAPKLIHLLKGDLDWIVMKCLEKDRTRRYETAHGLAADLKRFLANEAVVARPPTTAYKISKFVRRNRLAVGAAAVVLVALLLGLGSATFMFFRERAAHQGMMEANRRVVQEVQARVVERAMNAAMSGDSHAIQLALEAANAEGISGGQIAIVEGLRDLAAGQSEEAVKHLREAIKTLPDSVVAHSLLATASLFARDYENHLVLVAKLATLKEQTPEDYLFKAQALSLGNWQVGLPLLDRAVDLSRSALAHMLRAEARALYAGNTGRTNDIEAALEDVAAAKAMSRSQQHVILLVNSCLTHIVAAEIYRRAGNKSELSNHLAKAEADGRQLEKFSGNSHAAMWRIWQLEIADQEEGSDRAIEYLKRLILDQTIRYPWIRLSYGNALLRRGQAQEALDAYGVPHEGWTASMRLFALLELPDRRKEFEVEMAKLSELDRWEVMVKPLFLLYAGREEEARALAAQVIDSQPGRFGRLRPNEHRVMNYLAGRLKETDFVSAAHGALSELCLVHCVIGFQKLGDRDRSGAMKHFSESIDTSNFVGGPPYTWSQVTLAQLKRHETWPPSLP